MGKTAKIVSFSIPPKLLKEAEELAKKESRSKSELLREALRFYTREQRWEGIQEFGITQAKKLGITETDVENLVAKTRKQRR